MILVTGAAGKTGQAIISQLAAQSFLIRAWVRREAQVIPLRELGATEVVVGDLADAAIWQQATQNIDAIYFICPNMHPHEVEIGQKAIAAALSANVGRFVYHSVLHPQTQKMPHHWHKLFVEEALFETGLDVTIVQPAAYMQNIAGSWQTILEEGVYRVPYPIDTRFSVVDLEDVATVATVLLTQPGHSHAIYELAGPQNLTPQAMATILSQQLGRPIQAKQQPISQWQAEAQAAGLSQYALTTLMQMFDYYGRYHFEGNSNILRWLLGREPTDFATFATKQISHP